MDTFLCGSAPIMQTVYVKRWRQTLTGSSQAHSQHEREIGIDKRIHDWARISSLAASAANVLAIFPDCARVVLSTCFRYLVQYFSPTTRAPDDGYVDGNDGQSCPGYTKNHLQNVWYIGQRVFLETYLISVDIETLCTHPANAFVILLTPHRLYGVTHRWIAQSKPVNEPPFSFPRPLGSMIPVANQLWCVVFYKRLLSTHVQ